MARLVVGEEHGFVLLACIHVFCDQNCSRVLMLAVIRSRENGDDWWIFFGTSPQVHLVTIIVLFMRSDKRFETFPV